MLQPHASDLLCSSASLYVCNATNTAELHDACVDLLTWEQGVSLWEVEADVALGVAWDIVAVHAKTAKLEGITLVKCHIYAWDPALVGLGPDDLAAILGLELLVAASMIPVVVSVEDVVELAASRMALSAV